MKRSMVAITSSVLFAAGTTPMPMDVNTAFGKSTARIPLKQKTTPQEKSGNGSSVVDFSTMMKRLRNQRRLSEVHYAVANNTVLPIWQQDINLCHRVTAQRQQKLMVSTEQQKARQEKALQQKKAAEHRASTLARASSVSKPMATSPKTTRRMSSRSGASLLPGDNASSLGLKIAGLALSLVGSPYTWGGDSPSGFDCSGFAQYVYKRVGTVIPRTSYEQFGIGISVTKSELSPGDLVFFSTDAPGPSHVAVYVGNGLIVHALNSSKGVVVSRLDDPYYASRFIGARQVIR